MTLEAIIKKTWEGIMQAVNLVRYSQTEIVNVRGHEYTLKMRRNISRNHKIKPSYDYYHNGKRVIKKSGYTYRLPVNESSFDYLCVYDKDYGNVRLFDWDGSKVNKFGFPRPPSDYLNFWCINEFCGMKYVEEGKWYERTYKVIFENNSEGQEYLPFDLMLFSLYGFQEDAKKTELINDLIKAKRHLASFGKTENMPVPTMLEDDMRYALQSIYLASDGPKDPRFKTIAGAYVMYLKNYISTLDVQELNKDHPSVGFREMGFMESEKLSSLYLEIIDNIDVITSKDESSGKSEENVRFYNKLFHGFLNRWFDVAIVRDKSGEIDDPDLEKKMMTFLEPMYLLSTNPDSGNFLFEYIGLKFYTDNIIQFPKMMKGLNTLIDASNNNLHNYMKFFGTIDSLLLEPWINDSIKYDIIEYLERVLDLPEEDISIVDSTKRELLDYLIDEFNDHQDRIIKYSSTISRDRFKSVGFTQYITLDSFGLLDKYEQISLTFGYLNLRQHEIDQAYDCISETMDLVLERSKRRHTNPRDDVSEFLDNVNTSFIDAPDLSVEYKKVAA